MIACNLHSRFPLQQQSTAPKSADNFVNSLKTSRDWSLTEFIAIISNDHVALCYHGEHRNCSSSRVCASKGKVVAASLPDQDSCAPQFLDWSQLPKYHANGFFKKIEQKNPSEELIAGAILHNTLEIGEFDATVRVWLPLTKLKNDSDIYQENSPTKFAWGGGIKGVFNGEHSFHFEPSQSISGGTLFTQREEFTGAFSFVMGENFVAKKMGMPAKTHAGWKKYNEDLKRWCEQMPSEASTGKA